MAAAGLILLVVGVALALPWGLSGGSSYSRIAPISETYIQSTPGLREDQSRKSSWRRIIVGLVMAGVGVLFLVIGL